MGNGTVKYLKENWEMLQARYPAIAERMADDFVEKNLEVESVSTREDASALVVTRQEETVRLNSAYRPLQEAVKWADQYAFQNIGINVLMFGLGNGIFVRELLKRLGNDSRLFLVEPEEEILSAVLETEDISDILEDTRLFLYVGGDYEKEFRGVAEVAISWDNLSTQIRCEHPGYKKLCTEEYNHFWDIVKRVNEVVFTKTNTNAHFGQIAVGNVLSNISFVRESNYISELIGKIPEELPVVVVAAGPSLDKNVEKLREMENHALIIATDTAIRILEKRGLPYDCIVTIDPQKPPEYMTDYPGCAKKPLFLYAEARKEIAQFHTGRKIWMPDSVYLDNVYRKTGFWWPEHNSGGSVATSAFWLAKMLGLKNIVLIGQDLAFQGEKTHAGGHVDHIRDEERGIQEVEGIDGGKVKSRFDWVYYLQWFEEQIQKYPELNVIDATEGGALIHGSKVMTLSEVIEQYCDIEFSFADLLRELPPTFEVHDFAPVEKEFTSLGKGFGKILTKSQEGIKLADEFIERAYSLSAKRHDRLLKEIRKANNYMWHQPGYELVDTYSAGLSVGDLKDINCITGDPVQDEINTVKSAKALYEGFAEAAGDLQKQVQTITNGGQ